MKFKATVFLLASVAAMCLLLGTSAAQAADVIFSATIPTQAIGIEDLDVNGTLYDVDFTEPETVAAQVYGEFPGTFDFNTRETAAAAADAVNAALTAENAWTVGAEGSGGLPFYRIGFVSGIVLDEIEAVGFWESATDNIDIDRWIRNATEPDIDHYTLGVRLWAKFTQVGE